MDDFTPIRETIINKKESKPIEKKIHTYSVSVNGKKIKDENELPQIEKVGIDIGKQIMQARLAKNLKQADLAKQLNITPDIIRDYENGSAPLNKSLLNKIRRHVGIKC